MNIKELPEGVVAMDTEASVILDRYRLNMYNRAVDLFSENLLDKDANLVARLAQNAMKLALIHCVGRYAWDYDPQEHISALEINIVDATWAIEKIEKHFNHYQKMKVTASIVRKTITKSYSTDQDRIIYVITRLEGLGQKVTITDLMQQTGWLTEDVQKILGSMIKTNQIKMSTKRVKNKQVTYYTLVKPSKMI